MELDKVRTMASNTAQSTPLLRPFISSANLRALAKQAIKKMRTLALHTYVKATPIKPEAPKAVVPRPEMVKSAGVMGVRSTETPPSTTARVSAMRTTATPKRNTKTIHSGMPDFHSHPIITARPTTKPNTALR